MKISETKITNEGPLDLLTKQGRAQRGAFKSGQKTVKLTAQNLMRQFAEYLGNQGLNNYTEASIEDLRSFLNNKNVDTSDIADKNSNQALTKKFVTDYLTTKSREAVSGKKATANRPAARSEPSVSGQTKPSAPSFKSSRDRSGAADKPKIDVPKGMKMTGSDGNTYVWRGANWTQGNTNRIAKKNIAAELNKKVQSAISQLPNDIQDTVSKLTPDQKKILKSIL